MSKILNTGRVQKLKSKFIGTAARFDQRGQSSKDKGKKKLRVMMAGCLFSLESLIFNALLQTQIDNFKHEKYIFSVTTAQNGTINPSKMRKSDAMTDGIIRQIDGLRTANSDIVLFNFSTKGDVDSGTVAQFMIAKSQNIPSVCWRISAFSIGDTPTSAWNLMIYDMNNTAQYNANSFEWHNLANEATCNIFTGGYANAYSRVECATYVEYIIKNLAEKLITLAVTQFESRERHPSISKTKALAMWYPGDYGEYYSRVIPNFKKELSLKKKISASAQYSSDTSLKK